MKVLIASLFLALMFCGCTANVSENGLIRPTAGARLADGNTADGQWQTRSVDMPRADGVLLYTVLFSRPNATALVVYFGGNAFTISRHHQGVLDVYKNHGVDVLMVDHRGYGGSTGMASITNLMEDAIPAYDYARGLADYRNKPVIVHGQSLGSFMAGEVSKARSLDGLVLESSATTAEDWVQGFVDRSVFLRSGVVQGNLKGMGNLSAMATLDEPVLIAVGEKDTTTRSDMSVKLFNAARIPLEQKELLIVPNAGHNDASRSAVYSEAFSRLLALAKLRVFKTSPVLIDK
jgi:uncharacterized protein